MGAVIVRPDGFVGWRTQSSETKPRETLRGVYQRPLCKCDGRELVVQLTRNWRRMLRYREKLAGRGLRWPRMT